MLRRSVLTTAALLIATVASAAHDAPYTHAHPHADWSYTIAALLALGALAALIIIPLGVTAKAGSRRRGPR